MSAPRATMRLQIQRRLHLRRRDGLVPYFAALGISHLYASPIMTARPARCTVTTRSIRPGLIRSSAAKRGFDGSSHELRRHEMGLIVDIVPNHMAVGADNAWWMDVLARGRNSRYAKYFDIDWDTGQSRICEARCLLPVLGRPYGEALGRRRDNCTVRCTFSSSTSTICFRLSPASFRLSPEASSCASASALRSSSRPGVSACTDCSNSSTIGSLGGAQRTTKSTGVVSSTSMNSRRCVSRTTKCSRPCTPHFSTLREGLTRRRARRPRRRPRAARRLLPQAAGALARTRERAARSTPRRACLFRRRKNSRP